MEPTSVIDDFYPETFKEDPNGHMHRWQWIALLPFIDQERLLKAIASVEVRARGDMSAVITVTASDARWGRAARLHR